MLQVLGPLAAWRDESPVPLGGAPRRAVLALLALSAGSLVHRETIIDVLWPRDPPANAVNLVQAHVSRLRRLLDPQHPVPGQGALLASAGIGYRLQARSDQLDLLDFGRLTGSAREAGSRGDQEAACRLYRQAVQLWRGEPLVDVELLRSHPAVAGLSRQRAAAVLEYAQVASAVGWHEQVLGPLRELSGREPLNEQAHAQLMIALAGCGQQAEALAVYQDLCRRLDEELGIPPGPDLATAHERVLRQDIPPKRADPCGFGGAIAPAAVTASPATSPGSGAGLVVPRQLPAAPDLFVGRQAELSALDTLLDAAGGAVVISAVNGTAGVGKTALAVYWAHRVAAQFADGQLYANLRGFDPSGAPVPPGEVLGWFLAALGVSAEGMPVSPEARAGLYRSLLSGRRLLIVLDNARDADQVRPLLPGSAGCLVLVTSRTELGALAAVDGARLITLDALAENEAAQMLASRLGEERVAREPAVARELTELCARLPLALAIVSARASARPGFHLADLAAELRDESSRLDVLDAGDAASSVRAVFSWSYQSLADDAARMFRSLGLHPGPDVTARAAASVAAVPVAAARRCLRELTQAQLLSEHQPGRFGFHDLLRAYAARQAVDGESAEVRNEVIGRTLDHYLHTAFAATLLRNPSRERIALGPPRPGVTPERIASRQEAQAWFEAEHSVLTAAVTMAESVRSDAHAWQIPWALAHFLEDRGRLQEQIVVQLTALRSATRLSAEIAQADARRFLGSACGGLGEFDQARSHLTDALRLYSELRDLAGQARIHHALAWVAGMEGRHTDALRHGRHELELARAAGNLAVQAGAFDIIGYSQAMLGGYKQALTGCRRALDLYRRLDHVAGQASAWDGLGYAEYHLGHLDHAIACYRSAIALYTEAGIRFNAADTLSHLGDMYQADGKVTEAREAWAQALVILEDLRHPNADGVRAKLHARPARLGAVKAAT